jgi:indoleamine 2,3-dioxygenase
MICPDNTIERAVINIDAAQEFGLDIRTGFMPSEPPLARLPIKWEQWEIILDRAQKARLQLGGSAISSPAHAAHSERWRSQVRNVRSRHS